MQVIFDIFPIFWHQNFPKIPILNMIDVALTCPENCGAGLSFIKKFISYVYRPIFIVFWFLLSFDADTSPTKQYNNKTIIVFVASLINYNFKNNSANLK